MREPHLFLILIIKAGGDMSEPTIEEMRDQLVNNEVEDISEMVIHNRNEELFDYVYRNSWRDFKNIDDNDVREMYMDLYGDMPNE